MSRSLPILQLLTKWGAPRCRAAIPPMMNRRGEPMRQCSKRQVPGSEFCHLHDRVQYAKIKIARTLTKNERYKGLVATLLMIAGFNGRSAALAREALQKAGVPLDLK